MRLLRHPRFALARVFQEGLPGLSLAEYQVIVSGEGGSGSPVPGAYAGEAVWRLAAGVATAAPARPHAR